MPSVKMTANGITITDNSQDILDKIGQARERALEKIGLVAEGEAKKLCTVDGGTLRNSITHEVDGKDVYIGTNLEYAPYVEMGTGIYAEKGDGRKTPWVYKSGDGFYWTQGMRAKPFLRPAATDHASDYNAIIKEEYAQIKT